MNFTEFFCQKKTKPKFGTMGFRTSFGFFDFFKLERGGGITRVIIIGLLIVYIVKFYRFINNS